MAASLSQNRCHIWLHQEAHFQLSSSSSQYSSSSLSPSLAMAPKTAEAIAEEIAQKHSQNLLTFEEFCAAEQRYKDAKHLEEKWIYDLFAKIREGFEQTEDNALKSNEMAQVLDEKKEAVVGSGEGLRQGTDEWSVLLAEHREVTSCVNAKKAAEKGAEKDAAKAREGSGEAGGKQIKLTPKKKDNE
jgi:hypothetical protein